MIDNAFSALIFFSVDSFILFSNLVEDEVQEHLEKAKAEKVIEEVVRLE